jgi:hypothetical protein
VLPNIEIVNVRLTLDDALVRRVRKLAAKRGQTLAGMVQDYLEQAVAQGSAIGGRRRQREKLERSFEKYKFTILKRTWTRADLYERR